jgi:hypothetical protein
MTEKRQVYASVRLTQDQYDNPHEYVNALGHLAGQIRARLDRLNVPVTSGHFTTSTTPDGESVIATTVWEN